MKGAEQRGENSTWPPAADPTPVCLIHCLPLLPPCILLNSPSSLSSFIIRNIHIPLKFFHHRRFRQSDADVSAPIPSKMSRSTESDVIADSEDTGSNDIASTRFGIKSLLSSGHVVEIEELDKSANVQRTWTHNADGFFEVGASSLACVCTG